MKTQNFRKNFLRKVNFCSRENLSGEQQKTRVGAKLGLICNLYIEPSASKK
jgi:hypothetical protein